MDSSAWHPAPRLENAGLPPAAHPTTVAFCGLGIMGSRMAVNLRRAGFQVVAWNRTRGRAEHFAELHGATVADTPADAARQAQATVVMVVDAPEVESVLFGEDGRPGAAEGMGEGHLAIDMSTIAPSASRRIGGRLGKHGVRFLDAPVTGSAPRAADGTLTIMAGGRESDLAAARPLFDAMGSLVVHAGPQGHGSMVKLLNNTVAATNAAVLAEALVAAEAAGIDFDALIEVMRSGSGNSAMLELKGGPMAQGEFKPLFKLAHMLKDLRHTLRETEAEGAAMRVAASAEELYSEAYEKGHGDEDFAAVITAVQDQLQSART